MKKMVVYKVLQKSDDFLGYLKYAVQEALRIGKAVKVVQLEGRFLEGEDEVVYAKAYFVRATKNKLSVDIKEERYLGKNWQEMEFEDTKMMLQREGIVL